MNLIAVFLKDNRIITRDLPYIGHLTQLVKVDLSYNRIHFLPENLAKLTQVNFLMLDHNELIGKS